MSNMPVHVGNIINPQWLAVQMGLPVEVVRERLEKGRRIDGPHPDDQA